MNPDYNSTLPQSDGSHIFPETCKYALRATKKWDESDVTRSAHVVATDQMAMTQAFEFNLLLNKSDSLK